MTPTEHYDLAARITTLREMTDHHTPPEDQDELRRYLQRYYEFSTTNTWHAINPITGRQDARKKPDANYRHALKIIRLAHNTTPIKDPEAFIKYTQQRAQATPRRLTLYTGRNTSPPLHGIKNDPILYALEDRERNELTYTSITGAINNEWPLPATLPLIYAIDLPPCDTKVRDSYHTIENFWAVRNNDIAQRTTLPVKQYTKPRR